jgi:hypothetical protein
VIPSPWEAALLALAGFRLWKLLAEDAILDRPKEALLRRIRDAEPPFKWGGPGRYAHWNEFLGCPWCLGAWLVGAWWLWWLAWDTGALVAATPFALSAGVGIAAATHDRLTHYDS